MHQVPQLIHATTSPFNYPACWQFLHTKGVERYGPAFALREADAALVLKLLIYFLGDEALAAQHGIHLHKGVLLTGPVGAGKTALMHLMRHLVPPQYRYAIKPCREVAHEYAADGYDAILRYTRRAYNTATHQPIAICFDDLGLEASAKHFGNEHNSMAEVLLARQEHFLSHHMLTHLTTNLTAADIQDRYGQRLRSRMREMFNLLSFPAGTPDKRT